MAQTRLVVSLNHPFLADTGTFGHGFSVQDIKRVVWIFPCDACAHLSSKLPPAVDKNSYVPYRSLLAKHCQPQDIQLIQFCKFPVTEFSYETGDASHH